MRRSGITAVILLSSCASPTLKEYESRVELGRARLATIAKAQYERDRSNQDLLLIYAALAGSEASPEVDRIRETPGPFASFLVGKSLLCGLPMEGRRTSSAEVAHKALEAMDRAGSALSSLYRLEWLKHSTRGERGFWRDCRSTLQEALVRDRWDSPIREFHLKWLTWLDAHEGDSFVKVNTDLRVGDGHYLVLTWLARQVSAVLSAPVPPDPLILEVSGLLQKVCERLQQKSIDSLEFQVAGITLQIVLPARFLGLWRTGDFAGAEAACAALDAELDRHARYAVFARIQRKRYGDFPLFFRIGLDRMHEAFLPTIVAARGFAHTGKSMSELEPNEEGLLEGYRLFDAGGAQFLKAWREDMSASAPVVTRILKTEPAGPPPPNALRWALRDKAILEREVFPIERQGELLGLAFGQGSGTEERPAGIAVYSWLLKEALLRTQSVPLETLKSLKVHQVSDHLDLLVILNRRGAPVTEAEYEPGISNVKDVALPSEMKGYCQLLSLRARKGSAAAAALLPDYLPESFKEGWAMIGETLRHVTGQDLGTNLAAWKQWLETP